jgi:long-chain acyl-CoA synthetase
VRVSTLDYYANPRKIPSATLVDLFLKALDTFEGEAFRFHDGIQWNQISWRDGFQRIRHVAGGLASMGLRRGDRAAILSENRPEWAFADYGCLVSGIIDVPIYATLTPEQVAYVLNDSGARLVFLSSRDQLAKVEGIRAGCPDLEHVVVFDSVEELPQWAISWEDFLARGAEHQAQISEEDFRREALRVQPDDLATILYTSGTTGNPKGVMLTHENLASNVEASALALPITSADVTLSFLPLSHVFQRMVDYLLLTRGCTIAYARSLQLVPEDMRTVRPTIVVSVPRLYEKVYNKVTEARGLKGSLVRWAQEVGEARVAAEDAGRELGGITRAAYRLADILVFKKLRQGLGGRLRFFVSGGAPLSPDINRFFYSAGVMILEGYGLTETSPVTNVNSPEAFRIGTVGKPVANTEIQIAGDGEILVRGPQVMKGYYKLPEATADAIDDDGWFHTGDIGEIDGDGFLKITDRKKDIIVTAGGKNIAPQPIENRFKRLSVVDQVVMIGDRRKFPILLVVPSFEILEAWAKEQGIPLTTREDLLSNPRVQGFIMSDLDPELEALARFERPKKVGLLRVPFSIEAGDMTPTEKVRRRVVERRYGDFIDSLFSEESAADSLFVAPPPAGD